jgi:predicted metal-dependent hydrolase
MPAPPRDAPDIPLPPYSYVPGHGLPHPVTDPLGHLFNAPQPAPLPLDQLPDDSTLRRQAIAALFATHSDWLYALDLFNEGYAWEAHEAWERFWHALGRTTPEARFVQGLIHLAAACVKIREGKPAGVTKHTKRARELLGGVEAASVGESGGAGVGTLGLDPASVSAVLAGLERYRPECWQTSRCPVVKVVSAGLRVAE